MTDLRDWREANFDRFETDEEMADYEAYCQDCDFLNGYSDEDELYDMEYPETQDFILKRKREDLKSSLFLLI